MTIKLPTEDSMPVYDIQALLLLVYGEPKIGKSTYASTFPNPIFADIERGLAAIRARKVKINSWDDLISLCSLLKRGQHDRKTLVIDTLDAAVNMLWQQVAAKHGQTDLGDIGKFAKGYREAAEELELFFRALRQLHMTVSLLCHINYPEKDPKSIHADKARPMLPGSVLKRVYANIDMIGYATMATGTVDGVTKKQRVIKLHPSQNYLAGGRFQHLVPETLPLVGSKFVEAFNQALSNQTPKKGAIL
jgi:hypothetical protein